MQFLTVDDLSRMLKISRSKCYDLKDKIGWYRVGGSVRFREEDVLRYLDDCRVEGNEKVQRTASPRLKHLRLS